MTDKLYTVEEANALLPYLAPTLIELRDRYPEAAETAERVERAARSNGGPPGTDATNKAVARVQELMARLEEWGLQLRDLATGLVDFPGRIEGRDVWLCWRLGEPEVAFWHGTDEGIAGRKPL